MRGERGLLSLKKNERDHSALFAQNEIWLSELTMIIGSIDLHDAVADGIEGEIGDGVEIEFSH